MSTCLDCRHWTSHGVPAWAGELGHALCSLKQTRAVTLAHWAACDRWAAVGQADVDKRVAWLRKRGVVRWPAAVADVAPTPLIGTPAEASRAGNSPPGNFLVGGNFKQVNRGGGPDSVNSRGAVK